MIRSSGWTSSQDFADAPVILAGYFGAEAHDFRTQTPADNPFQPIEGSAADKQNVGGVDLHKILLGMFSAALGRHAGRSAFDNFQQGLLHAFTGNIPRDGRIVRFAGDLVDLVNVNDAAFGFFHVVIGILKQGKDDVFDILANVSGFGEARGIGNGKRYIQKTCQGLCQQGFPASGRTDEQYVAFLKFHGSRCSTAEFSRL